ncbi:hypothetical protein SERLADRAFT_405901 [Serpula lacrymans var. lacrymans S7.9]|uniref:CxC1-like cysteine cluster associated with KDZ transposases domain-containing protein n=1 Tax=Serpula lacrymans var. lacrymans (strain S7.9) TaxID=578457 RepID=F8NJZ9_SERL9|nr:uncharacterized protein SERLADRAFT_405901 [Serpula lacrymans var. lacrymans S7.9]EGO28311.1 hypothetical protein SERLADRAFT_405901 [Serpula lacrymans var. lacrymans S7.9]
MPALYFQIMYTIDGNDSLKQIIRRTPLSDDEDEKPGPSSELPSPQYICGDCYSSTELVDRWAHGALQNMLGEALNAWRRCGGVFDETGIFLALCYHGISLVVADIMQSGELGKYPLAVVAILPDVFGEGLAGSFDINCKFKTTLWNSPLGPQACTLNHTCLVGTFHGHAHRRLCQLNHLAMYVEGLGLEDLEGCKCAFSKSNALALSVQYASIFHQKQAINTYFEHNDLFEVYYNLSMFLYNNYKQALDILATGPVNLAKAMQELQIVEKGMFESWLQEEETYLTSLCKEQVEETHQMEYWQKLAKLTTSEDEKQALAAATNIFSSQTPTTLATPRANPTQRTETAHCHAQEKYEKILEAVQAIEMGYALHKHIGKVLQAQSAAIWTALDHYNAAAKALQPPCCTLDWKQVVEYAFLVDFDLLRDAQQDILSRPWATLASRLAMNEYFKISSTHEEIKHLNVEIRRFAMYLHDEDIYLCACEKQPTKSIYTGGSRGASMHTMYPGWWKSHGYQASAAPYILHSFGAHPLSDGWWWFYGWGEMAQAADSQEDLEDGEEVEEDTIKISAAFEHIVHISGNG